MKKKLIPVVEFEFFSIILTLFIYIQRLKDFSDKCSKKQWELTISYNL